jgi:hypothetical protein
MLPGSKAMQVKLESGEQASIACGKAHFVGKGDACNAAIAVNVLKFTPNAAFATARRLMLVGGQENVRAAAERSEAISQLQLWSCSAIGTETRCEWVSTMRCGPVWSIAWCPEPCDANRAGLVAVCHGNGTVAAYNIPQPQSELGVSVENANAENPVEIALERVWQTQLPESEVGLSISWSHASAGISKIAVGTTSGAVHVWYLTQFAAQQLAPPDLSLLAHASPVLGVSFNPFENNELATAGTLDMQVRFWNMRFPRGPSNQLGVVSSEIEGLIWSDSGVLLATCDGAKVLAETATNILPTSVSAISPHDSVLYCGNYNGALARVSIVRKRDEKPLPLANVSIGGAQISLVLAGSVLTRPNEEKAIDMRCAIAAVDACAGGGGGNLVAFATRSGLIVLLFDSVESLKSRHKLEDPEKPTKPRGRQRSEGGKFPCPYCEGPAFSTQPGLRYHTKQRHPDKFEPGQRGRKRREDEEKQE